MITPAVQALRREREQVDAQVAEAMADWQRTERIAHSWRGRTLAAKQRAETLQERRAKLDAALAALEPDA